MSLQIIRQGLLDTIQDCGRQGHRHLGIPPGGAMDIFSAVLSNALLGKGATGPVIELHFPAASIMFHRDTIITLAGGDFSPAINNIPVPLHQPIVAPAGSRLTFGDHSSGARCYLSVLQGLSCSSWLGSCAKGPGAGDAMLKAGDIIEFSEEINLGAVVRKGMQVLHWGVVPPPHDLVDIECMYGDEWNRLQQASQQQFLESVYTISPVSDRMGYRLI
ncbi:MAG TPA: biotin-dependent carboxyltransferase family protein, partial [Flavisolibacter sp.]